MKNQTICNTLNIRFFSPLLKKRNAFNPEMGEVPQWCHLESVQSVYKEEKT